MGFCGAGESADLLVWVDISRKLFLLLAIKAGRRNVATLRLIQPSASEAGGAAEEGGRLLSQGIFAHYRA